MWNFAILLCVKSHHCAILSQSAVSTVADDGYPVSTIDNHLLPGLGNQPQLLRPTRIRLLEFTTLTDRLIHL